METEFLKRISQNPEIINITKFRENNGLVCYSEHINDTLIDSLNWVYQNYFNVTVNLFVPKIKNGVYEDAVLCTLEVLEHYTPKKNEITVFAWSEFICKEIPPRRFNTLVKKFVKKNKVIFIGFTSLKCTHFSFLETFDFYEIKSSQFYKNFLNTISLFDLIDPVPENYNENLDSFIDFVSEFKNEQKSVYISLNLQPNKLVEIENLLKEKQLIVSRKEDANADIVINSCKTTEKIFLNYDILIFAPPLFDDPIEFICFFKDFTGEIFIDSSKIKNITQQLKSICDESFDKRPIVKDSAEFERYKDIVLDDFVMATECYYNFQAPESLLKLDLTNLVKKDYDLIRTFVKNRLTIKHDIEVKTCQLAAPCSPRDRSKKLNSLSNKLSSFDYRCDCTCEIFKDYTIGVVVWNDFFRNRKKINVSKNTTFVYQTTRGTWKYTSII